MIKILYHQNQFHLNLCLICVNHFMASSIQHFNNKPIGPRLYEISVRNATLHTIIFICKNYKDLLVKSPFHKNNQLPTKSANLLVHTWTVFYPLNH